MKPMKLMGSDKDAAAPPRRGHQRLRIGFLVGVHVYIVLHFLAWYVWELPIWGKTAMLGMLSALAGQINAAAVMVIAILISIVLWGRLFCGWFCHLRGSIELADWTLRKLGVEPYKRLRDKNVLVNTRFRWSFRAISMGILLLPIVFYWAAGRFRLNFDPEPIAPMADLPGYQGMLLAESAPVNVELAWAPLDIALAFGAFLFIQAVIAFGLNYYYGQGAFCRILCPYAAIFAGLMNLNPWQTKITRTRDCTGCRKCSNTCPQGIDVSREIFHYDGKVINRECIKCYRCVDICEDNVLANISGPAAPQNVPRKEYERRPWLNEEKQVQVIEPLSKGADLGSVMAGVFCGAVASTLGGFWFYVGAIVGFVGFRRVAVWIGSRTPAAATAPRAG